MPCPLATENDGCARRFTNNWPTRKGGRPYFFEKVVFASPSKLSAARLKLLATCSSVFCLVSDVDRSIICRTSAAVSRNRLAYSASVKGVGGFRPGDLSHSLMWAPVSACRALRIRRSRSKPGGSVLASSRRRIASAASRSSNKSVCVKRRRFCIRLSLHSKGGGIASSVLITDSCR